MKNAVGERLCQLCAALDARPLNRIRDGWLAGFSRMQVDSLKALRKRVEAAVRRSTSRA